MPVALFEATSRAHGTPERHRALRMMRRVLPGLAIVLAATFPWMPIEASSSCTGWTSESIPPPTIRVLRTTGPVAGSVAVVPFRDYVATVLPPEWSDGPAAAVEAGAIAVKQYAWYWTIHWRGHTAVDGSCYDVADSTIDQVYAPETQRPTQVDLDAIAATWPVTLRQSGWFFATGYREGLPVECGADADGRLLYQVSLYRCAAAGMDLDAILHRYLDPGLEIISDNPPRPDPSLSIMAPSTLIQWGQTAMFSAQLREPAGSQTSLANRAIRLDTSPDGVTWSAVATAASDAQGVVTFAYRPITNLLYRAAFEATTDLGQAASPTIRVVVRQVAIVRLNAPETVTGRSGGTVTVSVTVRPARSGVPAGTVAIQLWRSAHGTITADRTFTRLPNDAGVATLSVHLSSGTWGLRVRALPSILNANSVWTSIRQVSIP